jgi:hypothetical protein
MAWWRRRYGASPLHLLGLLASFAVAAYAVRQVFGQGGGRGIVLWFAACVIVHDFLVWPLYALCDRLAIRWGQRHTGPRRLAVPWINHVRVPVVISSVLFAISFPLIFRLSNAYYEGSTGFTENAYLSNWLYATGVLFAVSAAIYAARLALYRRRLHAGRPRQSDAEEVPARVDQPG